MVSQRDTLVRLPDSADLLSQRTHASLWHDSEKGKILKSVGYTDPILASKDSWTESSRFLTRWGIPHYPPKDVVLDALNKDGTSKHNIRWLKISLFICLIVAATLIALKVGTGPAIWWSIFTILACLIMFAVSYSTLQIEWSLLSTNSYQSFSKRVSDTILNYALAQKAGRISQYADLHLGKLHRNYLSTGEIVVGMSYKNADPCIIQLHDDPAVLFEMAHNPEKA